MRRHIQPRPHPKADVVLVVLPSSGTLECAAGRTGSLPIVFLTRDGCVNTGTMRARLDEALDRVQAEQDYEVVNADTLAESDARRGYGTPTVLYDNRDLFCMPEPTPPVPSQT